MQLGVTEYFRKCDKRMAWGGGRKAFIRILLPASMMNDRKVNKKDFGSANISVHLQYVR